MKKASIFLLIILFCWPVFSYASSEGTTRSKTWNLLLPVSSGVSPALTAGSVITGVSDIDNMPGGTPFCLDGVVGATTLDLSSCDFNILFIQPGTLKVLTGATPGYTDSNATFGIYLQASETEAGLSGAEKIPIFVAESVTSETTPWSRPVDVIHDKYAKISFKSDCTVWATSGMSVWTVKADPGLTIQPVRTGGTTVYEINTNSGVSSIDTVPEGTRKTVVTCKGSDVYYRLDATDPNASWGEILDENDEPLVILGYQAAEDFRFRESLGGSGSSLFVTHYTR